MTERDPKTPSCALPVTDDLRHTRVTTTHGRDRRAPLSPPRGLRVVTGLKAGGGTIRNLDSDEG